VSEGALARRYIVSGRVQGVGYRNFVQQVAERIGVSGYARNRRDGSVEVFAMGSSGGLEKLRAALRQGPMMARVKEVLEEPAIAEDRFVGTFTIESTF
jgi:acylphosphatase